MPVHHHHNKHSQLSELTVLFLCREGLVLLLGPLQPVSAGISFSLVRYAIKGSASGSLYDSCKTLYTCSSVSTASIRPSRVVIKVKWATSLLGRFSPSFMGAGQFSLRSSMTFKYSSFVEAILVKVAVTFQGLVETYSRGEAKEKTVSHVQNGEFSCLLI